MAAERRRLLSPNSSVRQHGDGAAKEERSGAAQCQRQLLERKREAPLFLLRFIFQEGSEGDECSQKR